MVHYNKSAGAIRKFNTKIMRINNINHLVRYVTRSLANIE